MPLGALAPVTIVSVEMPEPGTLPGLNDALVCAGNPLTLNITVAENGPRGDTVTVYVVVEDLLTVRLLGEAAIEKSTTESVTCVV